MSAPAEQRFSGRLGGRSARPELRLDSRGRPADRGSPYSRPTPSPRTDRRTDPAELIVAEVFGPTFQGEGRSLGQRVGFVRLSMCNLDCGTGPGATWACDTPYTWDWTRFEAAREQSVRSTDEIVEQIAAMAVDRVVITGGEPMIQQRRLVALVDRMVSRGWSVEVETNGTIAPQPRLAELVAQFNVSPKVRGSGVPAAKALRPRALAALRDTGRAVFKFVASDPDELDEIAGVVDEFDLSPVMIMPAGTRPEEIMRVGRALADPVLARGWELTTRLHVLLWGDERGR